VAEASYKEPAQIKVLDTGGQYCHLIARKVRELGVSAEVMRSDTSAGLLAGSKALIISGGPSSVYEPGSPVVDPAIFDLNIPVLGICYGQQLMAHALGGKVTPGQKGEYGLALLDHTAVASGLLAGTADHQQIWMSHRDSVATPPAGFAVTAFTSTCAIAGMEDPARRLFAIQFHPEVVHTIAGPQILSNFLFPIAGCVADWHPNQRVDLIEQQIKDGVGDRNVFFFVSGGVDSTVAFTLCVRALGADRVRGVYVDTGLMRDGETEGVRQMFDSLDHEAVTVEHAEEEFVGALRDAREPEQKRAIIGEAFVAVQERIIKQRHLLDGHWILGQGTIYPDTIESGGTSQAALIKTHHNRVAGIQKLIEAGNIVEPLSAFYKDEVRAIGRELGLPAAFLDRHPFPGPGLAIRCLCSTHDAAVESNAAGYILPIKTVGVQGDSRTYAHVLVLDRFPSVTHRLQDAATEMVNSEASINRVVARVAGDTPVTSLRIFASAITSERLALLRQADALVRRMCAESGFEEKVWQFPVVLIPVGTALRPDSIVLRPIDSTDGMTAQSVAMPDALLNQITSELLALPGVSTVFYDLTHKPPATIEWE
jgi:GMP synthase (glutamine-hydrolysing)